ncbi:hypothetical protein LTR66_013378, partial [Elasticomyces elasticus]
SAASRSVSYIGGALTALRSRTGEAVARVAIARRSNSARGLETRRDTGRSDPFDLDGPSETGVQSGGGGGGGGDDVGENIAGATAGMAGRSPRWSLYSGT